MSGLVVLAQYYQERFRPFPWLIVPLLMAFLISCDWQGLLWPSTIYLLSALLFYRLFDDLMMSSYDSKLAKEHRYLAQTKSLIRWLMLPATLYLSFTWIVFGRYSFFLSLGLILISFLLYHLLKDNPASLFISILKYPFLSYICAHQHLTIWGVVVFFVFLVNELIEEHFIPLKSYTKYLIFILALSAKTYWSFL